MSKKTTERERRNWLNKPDISVNGPIIMRMIEEKKNEKKHKKKEKKNSFLISLYILCFAVICTQLHCMLSLESSILLFLLLLIII